MEAIFRVDGADVVTSPDAAGPWDPNMQHGGAPASLVVWAAERIPAAVPMQVARVTYPSFSLTVRMASLPVCVHV